MLFYWDFDKECFLTPTEKIIWTFLWTDKDMKDQRNKKLKHTWNVKKSTHDRRPAAFLDSH